MSTDNEELVPDSEASPSDNEHVDQNATDEDATPSQYKKSQCDGDDDGEHANDSESSSDDCIDQERMKSIDRDAAMKVDCKNLIRRFDQMAEDLRTIK
jgi:hypothetical protein